MTAKWTDPIYCVLFSYMPNQNIIVIISSCYDNFHYPKIWNPSFSNLSESPISIRYVIVVICSNFVKFYWIYISIPGPSMSTKFYWILPISIPSISRLTTTIYSISPVNPAARYRLDPEFSEKMCIFFLINCRQVKICVVFLWMDELIWSNNLPQTCWSQTHQFQPKPLTMGFIHAHGDLLHFCCLLAFA